MSNYEQQQHYVSSHGALRSQSNSFCNPTRSGPSKSVTEASPRSHHRSNHNQSTTHRISTKSPSIREEYLNQIQRTLSSQKQQQQPAQKSNLSEQPCMDVNSANVTLLLKRVIESIKHDQILATLQLNETSREFLECRVDEIISNECISELNVSRKLLKSQLKLSQKETAHARSQVEHFESLLQQSTKQIASLNQTIQMLQEKLDQSQIEKQQAVQTSNRLASVARTAATSESMKQSLVRISAEAAVRIADMQVSHDLEVAAIKDMNAKAISNYQSMLEQQCSLEEQNTSHTSATIGILSKNIADLQAKLALVSSESSAKIQQFEQKNSILQNELESLRKSNDSAREKIRELESTSLLNARVSKEKNTSITAELVKIQEEMIILLSQNAMLSKSLHEFQKQVEIEKEKSLKISTELKAAYDERVSEVLKQLTAGEDQLLIAVSESEAFKDRLREKEALFTTVSQQLTQAKNAVSAGTKRITEVSSELHQLKSVNASLELKINELNRQLSSQQQQQQQKQSSNEMPMQSRKQVKSFEKQEAATSERGTEEATQKCKQNNSHEDLVIELKQNLFEKDLKLRQSNQRVDHLEIRLRVQEGSFNKRVASLMQELRELNSKVVMSLGEQNEIIGCATGTAPTTNNRNSQFLELIQEQQVEILQKEAQLEELNCEIERLQEVVEDLTTKNLALIEAASKKSIEGIALREGGVVYTAAFEQEKQEVSDDVNCFGTERGAYSEMEFERVIRNRLENAKKFFFGVISRMNQENKDVNQLRKQLSSSAEKRMEAQSAGVRFIDESNQESTQEVEEQREVYYVKLQETLAQYEKEILETERFAVIGVSGFENQLGVQSEIQKHKDSIEAIRTKILGGVKNNLTNVESKEDMRTLGQSEQLSDVSSGINSNNQSGWRNRNRNERVITPIRIVGDENDKIIGGDLSRKEEEVEILTATFNSNKVESNHDRNRTQLRDLSTSSHFNHSRNPENILRSSFEEANAKRKVFVDDVLRKLAESKHSKKNLILKQ